MDPTIVGKTIKHREVFGKKKINEITREYLSHVETYLNSEDNNDGNNPALDKASDILRNIGKVYGIDACIHIQNSAEREITGNTNYIYHNEQYAKITGCDKSILP